MRPLSLRIHLVIGAAFWTFGLFGLAIVLWHVTLQHREPPGVFFAFLAHPHSFAIACLVCLGAGGLQVRRGWRSINQVRGQMAALHAAPGRRLQGVYPAEIEPLVEDVNRLLDQRDLMIDRATATAADLAHGLKTPLAVLAQEADRLARDGHPDRAGTLRDQIDRMRRQVDAHLARSRADVSKHRVLVPIGAADAVAGLVRTLSHLYAERGLTFVVDVDAAIEVRVAREDLDEIIGNLLDNACKWARTRCGVAARPQGDRVVFTVEDDGLGIPASVREDVLARGVRADQAVPGTGLGLSIVRDLVEAYGGRIVLGESPLGGLRVEIDVPAREVRT